MTQGLVWETHGRKRPERRRPRKLLARAWSAFAWALFGIVALAVYTNVIADDAKIRERAESIARTHAACGARCHVSKMDFQRNIVGYRAAFQIDGVGSVQVECRRDLIVAGEQRCHAQ